MTFEIEGKVALITGGASGIGLQLGKELLQHGLKHLAIADINSSQGKKAVEELSTAFGKDRVLFVQTDVTDKKSFEEAFKVTVDKFKNIDILVNGAGILNDAIWEKQIAININGVVNGTLLAQENYILNHKTGAEGLIVNMSSIAGANPTTIMPVYSATKSAVLGLTYSFGNDYHYKRTGIRVVAVCPGVTATPLWDDLPNHFISETFFNCFMELRDINKLPSQSPEELVQHMLEILTKAPSGTAWICEGGEKPYEFSFPDRFTMEKKFLC